jgi:COMPASS component SPP1
LIVLPVVGHAYDPDADSGGEDDRLYCICQTKYDPEKMMIACDKFVRSSCLSRGAKSDDRCDEWYHTDVRTRRRLSLCADARFLPLQCLRMQSDEVELINDFICPKCQASEPSRNLSVWRH